MSDRGSELIHEEDAAWTDLCALLAKLTPADMERPGLTKEWTVKDMLGHLASWWAEAGRELERIRAGTYRLEKPDVDEMNRGFFEANSDLGLDTIRAELSASRNKALADLGKPPAATP